MTIYRLSAAIMNNNNINFLIFYPFLLIKKFSQITQSIAKCLVEKFFYHIIKPVFAIAQTKSYIHILENTIMMLTKLVD